MRAAGNPAAKSLSLCTDSCVTVGRTGHFCFGNWPRLVVLTLYKAACGFASSSLPCPLRVATLLSPPYRTRIGRSGGFLVSGLGLDITLLWVKVQVPNNSRCPGAVGDMWLATAGLRLTVIL